MGQPWTPRQAKWTSIGWAKAQFVLPNLFEQVAVCPSVYPSTCFQLEPSHKTQYQFWFSKKNFIILHHFILNSNDLLPYWMLHLQNNVGSSKSHAPNIWPIKCNSAIRTRIKSDFRCDLQISFIQSDLFVCLNSDFLYFRFYFIHRIEETLILLTTIRHGE